MLYSQGTWIVKAGKESEFVEAWTEFAEWSRVAGIINGKLLRDMAQPTRFIAF